MIGHRKYHSLCFVVWDPLFWWQGARVGAPAAISWKHSSSPGRGPHGEQRPPANRHMVARASDLSTNFRVTAVPSGSLTTTAGTTPSRSTQPRCSRIPLSRKLRVIMHVYSFKWPDFEATCFVAGDNLMGIYNLRLGFAVWGQKTQNKEDRCLFLSLVLEI